MSGEEKASYYFLPWVRYGLAQTLANQPLGDKAFATTSSLASRVSLKGAFSLSLNGDTSDIEAPDMVLIGPGDVVGIDPREIVRTMPGHQTPDFPPHLFPFVEFDRPDFPWLITPGTAANDTLLPWLVLVVLPKSAAKITTSRDRPLPTLQCPVAELPDLNESWAWAHGQYIGKPQLDQTSLHNELARAPLQNVSRLLCPRRLEPNKGGENGYIACLVPAFENGRRAGLGEDPGQTLAPAWKSGDAAEATLPVYYQWEFATGLAEDFEEMVDRLTLVTKLPPPSTGAPVPTGLMDVSDPGPDALRNVNDTLTIATALFWPDSEPKEPSPAFKTVLGDILERKVSVPVVPPAYGEWHAQGGPPWFQTLNRDPRYRVAAALATQVVQHKQEQLVAEAWEQAAKIRERNQWLRQQQLACAVTNTIFDKRLKVLKYEGFLQMTDTVHAGGAEQLPSMNNRVGTAGVAEDSTVQEKEDPLMQAVLSAPFRRMLRPNGTLARKVELNKMNKVGGLVFSISTRKLRIEPNYSDQEPWIPLSFTDPEQYWDEQKADLYGRVNPNPFFEAKVKARLARLEPRLVLLSRDATAATTVGDSLKQELYGPTFSTPMYGPLRDLFPEMLLPGLDRIPNNSIAVLQSTPAFIETYLVGLNHEMSRELLWREFPAPLGHTYFQQFWDVRGATEPSPDITPITDWRGDLGQNIAPDRGNLTFLLLRGDFLLRYPNTLIYAEEAQWTDRPSRKPQSKHIFPSLRVYPVPGIVLLGFDLPKKPGKASRNDPGWFFIFEEPPTDTRFGLDFSREGALKSWRELSWKDVTPSDRPAAKYLGLGDFPRSSPPPTPKEVEWGKSSAHMAYITLQKPYRRLVHSSVWWGYA